MTAADLVALLKAMRAEADAAAVELVELDLRAKRAALAGGEAGELAALHVADVRRRVADLRLALAAHTTALALVAQEAPR